MEYPSDYYRSEWVGGLEGVKFLFQSLHVRLYFSYIALKLLGEREPACTAKTVLVRSEKSSKGESEDGNCILMLGLLVLEIRYHGKLKFPSFGYKCSHL